MKTLYDLFKVQEDAPPELIKAAYRALSGMYHPDKNPGDASAAAMMQKINGAYRILRDPHLRAQYDESLKRFRERRKDAEKKTSQAQREEMPRPREAPSVRKVKRMGLIRRIWSGNAGLAKTYWCYGFLTLFVFGVGIRLFEIDGRPPTVLFAAYWSYFVFISIAIWRAATNYSGRPFWAMAAKFMVVGPFIIGAVAGFVLSASQASKEAYVAAQAPVEQNVPVVADVPMPVAAQEPEAPAPQAALPPQQSAQEIHLQRIYAAHPDASEVFEGAEFQLWLARTPQYRSVPADGTTQQVIDMFNAFKHWRQADGRRRSQENAARNSAAAEALARRYEGPYSR